MLQQLLNLRNNSDLVEVTHKCIYAILPMLLLHDIDVCCSSIDSMLN